jgi:DTW domain-containing protein YfiP
MSAAEIAVDVQCVCCYIWLMRARGTGARIALCFADCTLHVWDRVAPGAWPTHALGIHPNKSKY